MKTKIAFLFFTTFLINSTLFSQEKGSIALETQFDFLTKNSVISPNLKFRYFINESSVVRSTLNINYKSTLQSILELNGEGVGTVQKINSSALLSLGYEHHFSNEKISPYLGGELFFGGGKNDIFGQRTDSLTFVSSLNYSSKRSFTQVGIGLFTGVDITLYNGLYVGTELGFNFINTLYKQGEFRADDSASSTASTTIVKIPEFRFRNFSIVNMGVVRLGWKF